jgi:hypothetical protein
MCRFNVHQNKTADGAIIVLGLKVVTNEWRLGTVVADLSQSSSCCEEPSHSGQFTSGDYIFTDHQKQRCPDGTYAGCHHDHWFDVQYADGSRKMMNGERLGVRIPAGVE